MTRGKEQRWKYATIAMYTAVGVSLLASPAAAGKKVRSTTTTDDYYVVAGTSDPTNVPIVSSDLEAAAMVTAPEEQMQAARVWGKLTGSGIVVAVLDGGFNLNHPALAGHLAPAGYNAIDDAPIDVVKLEPTDESVLATMVEPDPYVTDYPYDDVSDFGNGYDDDGDGLIDEGLGHGTFVAGMVLRIAPEATILPIRVRDDEGYGLNAVVARGLRYAIDQRVDVINMSIEASDIWDDSLATLLIEAKYAGISVVLSAGNDGSKKISDMVWQSRSLVVGAVDQTDQIAEFSNYADLGAAEDTARMVYAPGVDLCGPYGFPADDSDACWSGTSFAAPLVSGAVALLRQYFPELTPDQIAERIDTTADPVTDRRGRTLRYSGRVNVWRAVTE